MHENWLSDKKHSNVMPCTEGKTILPAPIDLGEEILKTDSTLTPSNLEN